MARKIDQFPGGPSWGKYPWDQWFDGDIWELTPGEDFTQPATEFAKYARNVASKKHISAHIRTFEGKVYIQAELPGGAS